MRRALCIALFGLLSAGALRAAEFKVEAHLEPQVIGVDETAQFSIEVRSEGVSQLRFRPEFTLENLETVAGPFHSEDFQFVNGQVSRSIRITWQLRPLQPGPAKVKGLRILLRGNLLDLAEQEITVQKEPAGGGDPQASPQPSPWPPDPFDRMFGSLWQRRSGRLPQARPKVFLRAEVSPQQPWSGEQILYTVYLYTRDDINAINPRSLPTFRGFWVKDIPQPQNLALQMVEVGGERYGRVALLRKALFALRPGVFSIEPAVVDLIARASQPGPFGSAFSQPQELEVRTQPIQLAVKPLPAAPPGFAGVVGRVQLKARLAPPAVQVGGAATLTLELSGEGHLQGIPAPELPAVPGLSILPPQQQSEEKLAGEMVRGFRSWSYAVIPDRAGGYRLTIPDVRYFDPVAGEFRTAAAPPLALEVAPAPAAVRTAKRPAGPLPAPDPAVPLFSWLLPWLLAGAWTALLAVLLSGRARTSPAARGAADRLQACIRSAVAERRPRQSAALLEEGWRAFLAERWQIPATAAAGRWRELLLGRGAEAQAAAGVEQLTQDLLYLRNAPQLSAVEALRDEAVALSRDLLARLR